MSSNPPQQTLHPEGHKPKQQTADGLPANYEVDRLLQRIKDRIRCNMDPSHGSYDYICTNSESICDKLVCVECLRADPVHFNAHCKQFMRVRDFLDNLTTVVPKHHKQRQLDEIKYFEKRTRGLIDSFDRQTEKVISTIHSYFLNVQERYVSVLQKKIAAVVKKLSEDFIVEIAGDRQNLGRILEACSNFTKFTNKSHVLDLFLLLEKEGTNSNVELRKRFAKLNKLMSNFDRNVEDWLGRCGQIDVLDDRDFLPQVNLTNLNPHLSRHEQTFSNLLDRILPDSLDSIFTISSRKIVSGALAGGIGQSLDQSMAQQKQQSRVLGMSDEQASMILDPMSPFDQKSKRLQDIDRRIQEIFHESPEILDRRTRDDRLKLEDLSRSFREPEDSRLDNLVGIHDLMGGLNGSRVLSTGEKGPSRAEPAEKCKILSDLRSDRASSERTEFSCG